MREMISMVVVLTLLSALSGGLLAAIKKGTEQQIEKQVLENEKAPAIRYIFAGVSNNPVADNFKLKDGKKDRMFFVGVDNGKADEVAFECNGKGFGGDFGVMVAVNVDTDKIVGVSVTKHSETPGVGARVKEDLSFVNQFKGMPLLDNKFAVTKDGGKIDALSGATITSRGVCMATTDAAKIYKEFKPQIIEKLKGFPK